MTASHKSNINALIQTANLIEADPSLWEDAETRAEFGQLVAALFAMDRNSFNEVLFSLELTDFCFMVQ
jgi:hypothetical protein